MTNAAKRKLLIAAGAVTATAITLAVVLMVRQANAGLGTNSGLITDDQLSLLLNSKDVIAAGSVEDSQGRVIDGATIIFSIHNGDGQLVWRLIRPVREDGSFKIQSQDLPAIPNIYAGIISAEAPNYLAEKANVSVEIASPLTGDQSSNERNAERLPAQPSPSALPVVTTNQTRRTNISPQRIHLRLVPYTPWVTLIILVPALVGLLLAIMHLAQFTRGMWVTYWYTLGIAGLWALVVGALVWLYVRGNPLIPLFWSDFFVSSGVVVFAFIGNIVYVAYAIAEKRHSYYDADDQTRKGLLLRLGGRIFVAPYIALAAYGIFAATFPTLRTGPFAAFFGFFSGLWIKPILEALNDIGLRLLSVEERQKVAAEATRTENPQAPSQATSSALAARPEQVFLDAVNAAREELLQKDGVIGVAPGFKESALEGKTGQRSIIAYVYEKKDPENATDRVPERFMGYPTDVVPLPAADENEACREVAFSLSWEKLNRDHENQIRADSTLPHDSAISVFGQVVIIADPSVFITTNDHKELDAKRAFQLVCSRFGDNFDFVSFIIDRQSGLPFIGNYSVPVHNDIKGINHYKGDFYSVRSEWGTTKLLACQTFSLKSPDFRTYLHELAHSWCAYATFNDSVSGTNHSKELLMVEDPTSQALLHWGEAFDDSRSCMDYDQAEWVANANGTFTKNSQIADVDFGYCPLDLYLMGLLPPEQVRPLRILQDRKVLDANQAIYQATVKQITIQQIIASCGPRVPTTSPKNYRQAFVVISSNPESGRQFAKTMDIFRKQFEAQYLKATGAELSTNIS